MTERQRARYDGVGVGGDDKIIIIKTEQFIELDDSGKRQNQNLIMINNNKKKKLKKK